MGATLRAVGRVPRSRKLVAQYAQDLPVGWTTWVDQANQATYYVNEQTGQSQWEPPQQEYGSFDAYAQQQSQQQAPLQDYGKLDLDQYRQYTSDRGERVTETELIADSTSSIRPITIAPISTASRLAGATNFFRAGPGRRSRAARITSPVSRGANSAHSWSSCDGRSGMSRIASCATLAKGHSDEAFLLLLTQAPSRLRWWCVSGRCASGKCQWLVVTLPV